MKKGLKRLQQKSVTIRNMLPHVQVNFGSRRQSLNQSDLDFNAGAKPDPTADGDLAK
jgi:hypothetical protein